MVLQRSLVKYPRKLSLINWSAKIHASLRGWRWWVLTTRLTSWRRGADRWVTPHTSKVKTRRKLCRPSRGSEAERPQPRLEFSLVKRYWDSREWSPPTRDKNSKLVTMKRRHAVRGDKQRVPGTMSTPSPPPGLGRSRKQFVKVSEWIFHFHVLLFTLP